MVAFFDDDPVVIQGLMEKKFTALVKAAPYNAHIVGPHVVRFKDWSHIPSVSPIYFCERQKTRAELSLTMPLRRLYLPCSGPKVYLRGE